MADGMLAPRGRRVMTLVLRARHLVEPGSHMQITASSPAMLPDYFRCRQAGRAGCLRRQEPVPHPARSCGSAWPGSICVAAASAVRADALQET